MLTLIEQSATPATPSSLYPSLREALSLPTHEGARVVALAWLHELDASVAALGERVTGGVEEGERRDALHRASTALRQLRVTLREHRAELRLDDRRTRRALRRARRLTTAMLTRYARNEALAMVHHAPSPRTQAQAERLREQLEHDISRGHASLADRLDTVIARTSARLSRRLIRYTVVRTLGEERRDETLGLLMARRVGNELARLTDEVALFDALHAKRTLRRARRRFERHCAMLSPFRDTHDAIAAWLSVTEHGARSLRSVRDTLRLAALAKTRGHGALANLLNDSAADRSHLFVETWRHGSDAFVTLQQAAVQALETLAMTADQHAPAHSPMDTPSSHTPHALPAGHGLPMEIERKFLLHGLPPHAAVAESVRIEQGWLPGTLIRERLRRTTSADGSSRCTRTIKVGASNARVELEEPTDPALFAALWPLTVNARIRKRRHLVPDGALLWEVDVFLDRDLVLAEVELTHVDQLVVIPTWLAPFVVRDVTNEPAYLNSVMAQRDAASNDPSAR